MKTVDIWETVAAVAVHVEREHAKGTLPSSELGAYSVAMILADMNRAAKTLQRVETMRANGIRNDRDRTNTERDERRALADLNAYAAKLHITFEVEDMGYVTLTAGPYRLGTLPLKG